MLLRIQSFLIPSRRNLLHFGSVIIIACFLSACLPFPEHWYSAPEISGVITNRGVPVEGAVVHLESTISKKQQIVATDSHGHFSVGPFSEWQLFTTMGDPLIGFNVDIDVNGHKYHAYSKYDIGFEPEKLILNCDISRPLGKGNFKHICVAGKE